MLTSPFRKMRYALLLLKIGGLKVFFRQLMRQIYHRATFIGLEMDLNADNVRVPSKVEYFLRPASEEDMEKVVQKAKTESMESAHELIQRKWFYESGFHNCYIARTVDTGELCHIQWLVSSEKDDVVSRGFGRRLPRLRMDEILVENAFTFEECRGNRIMSSVMVELSQLARRDGFRRMIAYVHQDNEASLKGCEMAGFRKFEEIRELKLLFFTKRSHS